MAEVTTKDEFHRLCSMDTCKILSKGMGFKKNLGYGYSNINYAYLCVFFLSFI